MSNNKPPGQLHTSAQMAQFFTPESDGQWVEIQNGSHGAAAFVVWRMEDDERSPKEETFARKVAAVNDLFDALRSAHHMLCRDFIDDAKMAVIEKCDAAIAKATGEDE